MTIILEHTSASLFNSILLQLVMGTGVMGEAPRSYFSLVLYYNAKWNYLNDLFIKNNLERFQPLASLKEVVEMRNVDSWSPLRWAAKWCDDVTPLLSCWWQIVSTQQW